MLSGSSPAAMPGPQFLHRKKWLPVPQALFHAREYQVGEVEVGEPRDLGAAPPLEPPRHRLSGPPQTWLTGDWQGTATSLTFHAGTDCITPL